MLHQHNPHILVFDSGIGGMGVVQALRNLEPSIHIDYLADTALFPYGEQSDHLLTKRILTLLQAAYQELSPDLIIIACNTASTLALSAIRDALNIPIVGCVPPIRWAGRVSVTRTIGLLATSATAHRPYLADLHQKFATDCHLIVHGSAHLAQIAEQAFHGQQLSTEDVKEEITQLLSQTNGEKIDTIGLGCTHYTFLMPILQRIGPPHVMWLDPAPAVAQQTLRRLSEQFNLLDKPPRPVSQQYCLVTSPPHDVLNLKRSTEWLGFTHWSLFLTSQDEIKITALD